MTQQQQQQRTRDFERFITFIDATVAIAITLLILPLVDLVPELGNGSVRELLRSHLAQVGGFLLSFVVIARAWMAQHRAVRTVIAHDPWVTQLLLVWTLSIVVLPFPTALVAEVGSQPATKIFYIGTMAFTAAVLTALCWVVGRNRSIRDSDNKPDLTYALGSTVAFVAALGVSLAIPATGYLPLLLLVVPSALARLRRHAVAGRSRP